MHRLTYARRNHAQLHVHGYQENGTTTTPFDMVMLNDLDRFSLVIDVIDRVPDLGTLAAGLRQEMVDARLLRHDLAVAFAAFEATRFAGVTAVDKDPEDYVREVEQDIAQANDQDEDVRGRPDGSLGIGNLKGL